MEEEITIEVPLPEKVSKVDVNPVTIIKRQVEQLKYEYLTKFAQSKITQLASVVPFECSENCPFLPRCDMKVQSSICKLEEEGFNTSLYGYMAELEIDPEFPTEIVAAAELATIDVLEARCLKILGIDGVLEDQTVGATLQDAPITQRVQHPAFNVLSVLWKRRSEVKKELAATREQKEKLDSERRGKKTSVELITELLEKKRDKEDVIEAEYKNE